MPSSRRKPWTVAPNSKAAANLDLEKSCPRPRDHDGVLRRRAGRFRFLIRALDGMACAAFAAGFPEAFTVSRSEPDLNPYGPDLRKPVAFDSNYVRPHGVFAGQATIMMCPRGTAPKSQCVLTTEFALDVAGGSL